MNLNLLNNEKELKIFVSFDVKSGLNSTSDFIDFYQEYKMFLSTGKDSFFKN